jgi:hypothetical protein
MTLKLADVKPYLSRLRDMPYKNLRYFVEEEKRPVPGFDYEGFTEEDAFILCKWSLKTRKGENEAQNRL